MELEVNKSHQKLTIADFKKPMRRFTAGALLSLCIFSGISPEAKMIEEVVIEPEPTRIEQVMEQSEIPSATETIQIEDQTFEIVEDQVVQVPEEFRFNILFQLNKTEQDEITASDLAKIEYLKITMDSESNYDFLKYCTNLKDLQVTSLDENTLTNLGNIPTISSLESLSIYNIFMNLELTEDNITFLEQNPTIKYLEIDGILLTPGIEEKLNTLETLRLGQQENIDIDFSKLTSLKELDLTELEPYTLAMHLNTEEYNTLINNGVNVKLNENEKQMFLSANEKLDEIVSSLEVTKESTDREKLDAILLYALRNMTYDETIANISMEELQETDLAAEFYQNGLLYGALEKETAICGNYAAIVEALSDRLGNPEDSFFMTSDTHAWNLMNIDGEFFYVDSTWLDQITVETNSLNDLLEGTHTLTAEQKIVAGEGQDLPWYLEAPYSMHTVNLDPSGAHLPNMITPEYMQDGIEMEPVNTTTYANGIKTLASSTKLTVKVNDKEEETTLGAIVSVMVGFGLAVARTDKRNKKLKEEEKNQKK